MSTKSTAFRERSSPETLVSSVEIHTDWLPRESAFIRTFQDHPQVPEGQLLLCECLEEGVVLEVPLLAVPVRPDLHDVDHRVVAPQPLAQGVAGRRAGNEITRLKGSCCQFESKFLVTFLSAHH